MRVTCMGRVYVLETYMACCRWEGVHVCVFINLMAFFNLIDK